MAFDITQRYVSTMFLSLSTFPFLTSSLMDEARGKFSSEASVKTFLIWTNSSKVTNLPSDTSRNHCERTKSS